MENIEMTLPTNQNESLIIGQIENFVTSSRNYRDCSDTEKTKMIGKINSHIDSIMSIVESSGEITPKTAEAIDLLYHAMLCLEVPKRETDKILKRIDREQEKIFGQNFAKNLD